MQSNGRRPVFAVFLGLLVAAGGLPARAQALPSEPLTFGGGRVTIGGELSASFSCTNASLREPHLRRRRRLLQLHRLRALDAADAARRTDGLGQGPRSAVDSRRAPQRGYGSRAALRPVRRASGRGGRAQSTSRSAACRRPSARSPGAPTRPTTSLIGYPLAYQYLTSLRPDAMPANADELLRMRGRGWLSSFSIGEPAPDDGLPLVERASAGTPACRSTRRNATSSTPPSRSRPERSANPLVGDDNAGKQVAGRVALARRRA